METIVGLLGSSYICKTAKVAEMSENESEILENLAEMLENTAEMLEKVEEILEKSSRNTRRCNRNTCKCRKKCSKILKIIYMTQLNQNALEWMLESWAEMAQTVAQMLEIVVEI